ncbi:DUF4331 domain-containing protein [Alishewanella tabrizica]|uniref:DUF4331 domain-containing protein n=1 Tax=Alishewanella tabrizica TaxID=671278 RepID=A0ABQ2WLQ8_9ALTE|nr:DUF4331 domain-containing protein [Alishewanella tabrizica]GGW61818.1 hypothetical protein GCM10008111_17510 [Alishewanella tabrizica]
MTFTKTAIAITVALGTLTVLNTTQASSHREAPNITKNPTVDATDFYLFTSYESNRGNYVTMIANYIPLQDAYGGPNYFAMDSDAVYSIHVDNTGDAMPDISFNFRFTNTLANDNMGVKLPIGPAGNQRMVAVPLKNVGGISAESSAALNFIENYTVELKTGSSSAMLTPNGGGSFTKPYDNVGEKTFGDAQGYAAYADQYIYSAAIPNCNWPARIFVGQRKDPFVVNLGETFDLVNYVPVEGDSAPGANDGGGFPGGITQSSANDDLNDKNVTAIAIEVHKNCLVGSGNGVIGAWTTASLPQARILNPNARFEKAAVSGGALVQVSRLSNPLVNELVIGLPDKDKFNSSMPANDGQFADYVTHPSLPALLNILFKDAVNATLGTNIPDLAPSNFPRTDLVAAFLTGVAGVNQLATVTPSEMLRLNTNIPATPAEMQSAFGVAGNDLAGFPNGRRPGDDVVDIALRVVMGALCHDIPVAGTPTNLGFCTPADAPVGNVPFTDGAPLNASMLNTSFPYLLAPLAGSPN